MTWEQVEVHDLLDLRPPLHVIHKQCMSRPGPHCTLSTTMYVALQPSLHVTNDHVRQPTVRLQAAFPIAWTVLFLDLKRLFAFSRQLKPHVLCSPGIGNRVYGGFRSVYCVFQAFDRAGSKVTVFSAP